MNRLAPLLLSGLLALPAAAEKPTVQQITAFYEQTQISYVRIGEHLFPYASDEVKKYANKPAPELFLREWYNTNPLTKRDLEGKVVLVDFWATWCGPCLQSMPETQAIWEKYKSQGLVVLGVHIAGEGADDIPKIMKKYRLTFPIAVDSVNPPLKESWGKTFDNYSIQYVPQQWVIDKKGNVRVNVNIEDLLKE
jgi:thiol-disulfide isomerase/thioredoxin